MTEYITIWGQETHKFKTLKNALKWAYKTAINPDNKGRMHYKDIRIETAKAHKFVGYVSTFNGIPDFIGESFFSATPMYRYLNPDGTTGAVRTYKSGNTNRK